eukprot:gnl/Hemi2/16244_TR5399_c0_g1_i1.p2 gnl/Hemi2/16244_TR5399_c0_g1~~gnl/Hemi2/16244_TR5399_c0_g1_i1.p2  ORF type:complete len:114 (+),score=23.91 gnl/Hemi2/16244_TR5399_c0_g1_i1:332-673(+)
MAIQSHRYLADPQVKQKLGMVNENPLQPQSYKAQDTPQTYSKNASKQHDPHVSHYTAETAQQPPVYGQPAYAQPYAQPVAYAAYPAYPQPAVYAAPPPPVMYPQQPQYPYAQY